MAPPKMKLILLIKFGYYINAATAAQFASFLGCYRDDASRDLKHNGGNVKSIEKCRAWATKKKLKYFALQWGVQCFGDNSFSTPAKKYKRLYPQKCVRNGFVCGNDENMGLCGGGWANAMYRTRPIISAWVKERKPMQLMSYEPKTRVTYQYGANCLAIDSNRISGHYPIVKSYECDDEHCEKSQQKATRHYPKCRDSKRFQWTLNKKQQMVSPLEGWCLDMHRGNRRVYMHRCHNGNNQKWYWKNGANLVNKHNNQCLTSCYGNQFKPRVQGCRPGWARQRYWWNLGQSLVIKNEPMEKSMRFIAGSRDGVRIKGLRDTYRANYQTPNRCTQQGLCGMTRWTLIKVDPDSNWYWIRMEAYNSFLSTTPDGKKTFLWHEEDGSGRQRWKVKHLKDGFFHIMPVGGVKGTRKYLSSCHGLQDKKNKISYRRSWWWGTQFCLRTKDDGSGRNRWKLHSSFIPTPKPTPKPTPRPTPVPVRNLVSGGGWKVVKGQKKCTINLENGLNYPCALSPNFPKRHGREEVCEFSMKKTSHVKLHGKTEKWFDYLTLSGKEYSGKLSGKKIALKGNSNIKWTADFYEETTGWKICKSKKPRMKVFRRKKPN